MTGFLFSYGGENDFGKVITLGEPYIIDFPTEKEACYGLAFRRDVDISFEDDASEVTIELNCKSEIRATLEFKTQKSGGSAEEAFEILAKEGLNSFVVPIPKLNSRLVEICFCIFKNDNTDLKTEITVLDFRVK